MLGWMCYLIVMSVVQFGVGVVHRDCLCDICYACSVSDWFHRLNSSKLAYSYLYIFCSYY